MDPEEDSGREELLNTQGLPTCCDASDGANAEITL